MFEFKEDWDDAFAKAPDKNKFMLEHGNGSDLQPRPKVENIPTEDFVSTADFDPSVLPTEAEPATQEEIDDYANYVKQEEQMVHEAELERIYQEKNADRFEYAEDGALKTDADGNPILRELSSGEKMWNSVKNIGYQLQSALPSITTLGPAAIYEKLIGTEDWDKMMADLEKRKAAGEDLGMWDEGWLTMNDEAKEEALREKELADAKMGETGQIVKGAKEGDIGELAAGIVNGITSIGSSAVVNTLTLGGGLPLQFTGDFYKSYNEEVAKQKGKTLEELMEDGEDDVNAPIAFGMLSGLSERVGLAGAGKAIVGKAKGKIGQQVAHRLLSGNKEGLTELFQTGLEAASEAKAKGEDMAPAFAERVFSEEGLESYLQGFVGGGTLAGKGQNEVENVKKIQKVAAGLRGGSNQRKIDESLAKIAELENMKKETRDPNVKVGINEQLKNFRMDIKQAVEEDNKVLRHFTNDQIEQAGTIVDAAKGFVAMGKEIAEKRKAGEITQAEYNAAREGLQQKLDAKKEQLGKLTDKALQQPKIRGKNLTSPNATGVWNAGLKNKIDDVISTKGAQGAWDIIQSPDFKNFVGAKIKSQWDKVPSDLRDTTTFEDVMNEVMFGGNVAPSQTVLGTFKAYKGDKTAKPSSYFLGQIDKKILGAIQTLTQQQKAQGVKGGRVSGTTVDTGLDETGRGIIDESADVEAAPVDTRRRTAIEQAEKLGVGAAFTDEIQGKMETLVGTKLPAPDSKNFEKDYVKRFRQQIAPTIKKALGKGQGYIDYLNNNAEALIDVYSKKALAKRRDESFNWIEKRPTVEEFVNYHLPLKQGGKKDANAESKRKKVLADAIAEGLGFRAMEDTIEAQKDTTFRDTVNNGFDQIIQKLKQLQGERGTLQSNPLAIAPAVLEGAVIATKKAFNAGMNMAEAIQEGYKKIADKVDFESYKRWVENQIKALKSPTSWAEMSQARVEQEIKLAGQKVQAELKPDTFHTQFQETNDIAADDFAAQSQATDKILQQHGLGKTINTKNESELKKGKQWIENEMTKWFPKEFFQQGMFANAGRNGWKRGFFYDSKAEVDAASEAATSDPNSVWSKNGRYVYGNKDLETVKQNWSKIAENNKNNWAAFSDMWTKFDQMIKADPENARYIAAFLKGAQNSQNHISRTAAPLIAYSATKGKHPRYEEEHSLPQSAVSRYLIQNALEGNDMKAALGNVQKNFFQVALNKDDDHKLKKAGEYNYASKMPEGWKMSDNTWARYFNDNVNNNNGGIDPNSITFFESGQTVAQTYGAAPIRNSFPSWINETDSEGNNATKAVNQEARENFVEHLKKIWPSANIATDKLQAAQRIKRITGGSIEDAIAFVDRTNGFAAPDGTIYVDTDRSPNFFTDTAIHEMGHIWSSAYAKANPKKWAEGMSLIVQSKWFRPQMDRILQNYESFADDNIASSLFRKVDLAHSEHRPSRRQAAFKEVERIIGIIANDPKSNAWFALDEVFAGAIGKHGIARIQDFDNAAQSRTWQNWLNDFTSFIKNLVGFKTPKFSSAENFMDHALADIMSGEQKKSVLSDHYNNIQQQRMRQDIKNQTLAAFDFDDTLFKTNSQVIVNNPDGTFELLPTNKFPGHKLKPGQSYDFAQFNQVIEPQALETFNVLKQALAKGDQVTIVTARAPESGPAVMQLLEHELGDKAKNIKFVGVGHSSAEAKVNYITRAVDKYGFKNVYFADDAIKNTDAVAEALAKKGVNTTVNHVQADKKVDNAMDYINGKITWKQYEERAREQHAKETMYMKPDAWFQFTADLKQEPVNLKAQFLKADIARIANSAMNPADKEAYLEVLRSDLAKMQIPGMRLDIKQDEYGDILEGIDSDTKAEIISAAKDMADAVMEEFDGDFEAAFDEGVLLDYGHPPADFDAEAFDVAEAMVEKRQGGLEGFSFDMKQAPENVVKKAQQKLVAEQVGDPTSRELNKIIANLATLKNKPQFPNVDTAVDKIHEVYQETGNIDTAIEAGYQQVQDYTDRVGWAGAIGDMINEVKPKPTGAQIEMAFAVENAPELQQEATFNEVFNQIIEQKTKGKIKAEKVFEHRAQIGKPKDIGIMRRMFLSPFADDFKGLIYNVLPSGKEGDKAWAFFKENLIDPYQAAASQLSAKKAALQAGYSKATKLMSSARLNQNIPGTNYTANNAARVALAVMNGQEPTGVPKADVRRLMAHVNGDPKLQAYVNKVNELFDGNYEWSENATNFPLGDELRSMADNKLRPQLMETFTNNVDQIFTPENLNKIEAASGQEVRKYLEQKIEAMKTGKNRKATGGDVEANAFMDWINNSVGVIMFFNMRSAALQMLSTLNYFNAGGNNMFRAAAHMANIPQFRKDLKALWNSDYAKGRRGNLGFDISANEVADAGINKNGLNTLAGKIANAGFMPTQIMDSIATIFGGASYYRSQVNDLMKEGVPQAEAERIAYERWVDMTEEGQQSSDPMRVSAIQTSSMGRLLFAFGNTPFQYARVVKRASQDLANGRGNPLTHLKRIAWYGPVQSAIFVALQQALWLGDDDEKEKKADYALWGAIGSNLKALGLGGLGLSTTVAMIREFMKEEGRKDYVNVLTSISPPLSKKLRQVNTALRNLDKGFRDDDTDKKLRGSADLVEFATNIPAARVVTKFENLQDLVEDDMDASIMLMKMLGWSDASLSRKDDEMQQGRDRSRAARSRTKRERRERPKRERRSPARKLDDGIKGEANDDGTIQIDPNLKGKEREKVIKHEEKHQDEMKSGKLAYTDKSLTYEGKKYERKDGKINYNGKWLKEGSNEFPWEKAAVKAEKSNTPIKKKTLEQLYT